MIYRKTFSICCRIIFLLVSAALTLHAEVASSSSAGFADRVADKINAFAGLPGLTVNSGESRINGAPVPMKAISSNLSSEELANLLRTSLGGAAYVAVHHTEYSDVIVVTPKEVSNKEESILQSYVISVMNLPGGARLGMASPAGVLLRAQLRQPKLESLWLNQSRKSLLPLATASHKFADTHSLQEIAHCSGSIARCRMGVVSDLRADGFFAANPDEKVDSESNGVQATPDKEYSGVWRKGQTTVYINITNKSQGALSEVGIYEVTVK